MIILIGAARSGTKILRDTLGQIPGVAATPFDINYIWRLGNEQAPDDALTVGDASRASAGSIHRYLKKAQGSEDELIEKTVSNALRVGFVDALCPQAQYVLLVRDPADVIESAMRQWVARPGLRYSMRKAASYPWSLAGGYARRQIWHALTRTRGAGGPTAWGPVYSGMKDDISGGSDLLTLCTRQWCACTASAVTGFHEIGKRPVLVRYDAFVTDPLATLDHVTQALGLPSVSPESLRAINTDQLGRGRASLSAADLRRIDRAAEPLLSALDRLPVHAGP